jgi:hypothetical protein
MVLSIRCARHQRQGVVPADHDRVLVRRHSGQHAGSDAVVDGVRPAALTLMRKVPSVTSGVGNSEISGCCPAGEALFVRDERGESAGYARVARLCSAPPGGHRRVVEV